MMGRKVLVVYVRLRARHMVENRSGVISTRLPAVRR